MVVADELIVSVALPLPVPVMSTGDVVPKLNVGTAVAPDGLEVSAAVRVTFPVNPPVGVTVTVDVFPVEAPGDTETAEPLMLKLAVTGAEMMTVVVPLAAWKLASAEYCAVSVSVPAARAPAGTAIVALPFTSVVVADA